VRFFIIIVIFSRINRALELLLFAWLKVASWPILIPWIKSVSRLRQPLGDAFAAFPVIWNGIQTTESKYLFNDFYDLKKLFFIPYRFIAWFLKAFLAFLDNIKPKKAA
jgi:hypothetical protein